MRREVAAALQIIDARKLTHAKDVSDSVSERPTISSVASNIIHHILGRCFVAGKLPLFVFAGQIVSQCGIFLSIKFSANTFLTRRGYCFQRSQAVRWDSLYPSRLYIWPHTFNSRLCLLNYIFKEPLICVNYIQKRYF